MRGLAGWWALAVVLGMTGCGDGEGTPDAGKGSDSKAGAQAAADPLESLPPEERRQALHLKLLGLGLLMYQSTNNALPPYGGLPGEPPRSWRVWMAPYLEEQQVFNEYKFKEPWDSEANRELIPRMPTLFDTGADEGQTTIHVLTGDAVPFTETDGRGVGKIKDGLENTIAFVVAGPETAATWTQPGGLPFDPAHPREALGTLPESGVMVVMGDGSVWRLPRDVSDEHFKALATHDGGEEVRPADVPGAVRLWSSESSESSGETGADEGAVKSAD